jgi:hypothetical protein
MSAAECAWAFSQSRVTARGKLVLIILSDSSCDFVANFDYPSVAKVACLTESCVRKTINALINVGCIKYVRPLVYGDPVRFEAVLDERCI